MILSLLSATAQAPKATANNSDAYAAAANRPSSHADDTTSITPSTSAALTTLSAVQLDTFGDEELAELIIRAQAEQMRRPGSNRTTMTGAPAAAMVAASLGLSPPARAQIKSNNKIWETDNCVRDMQALCGGTIGGKCLACATAHAANLTRAGCSNARVQEICNAAELATVGVRVTPPNYTARIDGYAAPPPHPTFLMVRAKGGGSSSGVYDVAREVAPGETINLAVSTDPTDNYFFVATFTLAGEGGDVRFDMYAMQLRATVETGPIMTVPTLHWATFVGATGCISGDCGGNWTNFQTGGDGAVYTEATQSVKGNSWVANQTIIRTGTAWDNGGGWSFNLESGWEVRYISGPTSRTPSSVQCDPSAVPPQNCPNGAPCPPSGHCAIA
jgi:hypothetical protein